MRVKEKGGNPIPRHMRVYHALPSQYRGPSNGTSIQCRYGGPNSRQHERVSCVCLDRDRGHSNMETLRYIKIIEATIGDSCVTHGIRNLVHIETWTKHGFSCSKRNCDEKRIYQRNGSVHTYNVVDQLFCKHHFDKVSAFSTLIKFELTELDDDKRTRDNK